MENKYEAIILFIVISVIVLFMGFYGKKLYWIIRFIFRGVISAVFIYLLNNIARYYAPSLVLGLNPVTVLTSGFLGIPGVVALYGIRAIYFL